MSKRMEQLKDLVSDAEEVFHHMTAAKQQISGRMTDCFTSLQNVQDALVALSGSDVQTVLTKLKVRALIYTHQPLYSAAPSITTRQPQCIKAWTHVQSSS